MPFKVGIKSEFYKHIKGDKYNLYSEKSIDLIGIKNSFVAFNLFLENDENCQISLTNNPSFSLYPHQPTFRIELVSAAFKNININRLSYMKDDYGTSFTDCIENIEYFDVNQQEEIPLYIKIEIDKYQKAKKYQLQLNIYKHTLFQNEELIYSYPINITIKNIVMSDMKHTKLHLNLWQHLSNISRKHEVKLFSDAHFEIIERYIKSLADIGQKSVLIIASEIPWSGQKTFNDLYEPTDLFEYNYISITRDLSGDFICDYSVLDRYIKLCFDYGINKEIEVIGLLGIWMDEKKEFYKVSSDFPDGIRIRYYDQKTSTYKFMKSYGELQGYIQLLYEYFSEKNLLNIVRIIADEPSDINSYRKTIDAILEVAPSFKFKTAINHAQFTKEFDDVLSDFVPSLSCLNEDYDFFQKLAQKGEKRLSWYVCCRPHFPNTFIKSNLLESLFIGYFTSILNFDGFLRWNYTVWPENPREKIAFRTDGWLAGDMNFVYPGNFGGPLLTIRYMALRRLVECYDLLERAEIKKPGIKKEVQDILMGDTSIDEITTLGLDEALPNPPFSLDELDYIKVQHLLYDVLL